MRNWFRAVRDDVNNLVPAIAFFEAEFIDAKKEASLKGNLEQSSQAMPGIIAHRFGQLQEIEAILEHLNIELRKIRSKHYREYLEKYNRVLSSRDAEKFADGEDEVINQQLLVNEIALIRNKFMGIIKALEVKGFQLSNIVKLRSAGLDDINLD